MESSGANDVAVAEAKTLRKEIARVASDYDLEWKGELENLEKGGRKGPASAMTASRSEGQKDTAVRGTGGQGLRSSEDASGEGEAKTKETKERDEEEEDEDDDDDDKPLDIDKTIDEADELASQSREQRQKEQAAQRKGEVIDSRNDDTPAPRKRAKGTGGKKSPTPIERGEARAKKLAEDK